MNLKLSLNIQQRQQLIMTPRLQQAIKILLMPRLDLEQHIQQQLEQNPIIDEVLDDDELEEELKLEEPDPELNQPEENLDREDNETDIDWDEVFDDTSSMTEREAWEPRSDEDQPRMDIAKQYSLQDHLFWQLGLHVLSDEECRIGEVIIGNINDDGYLTVSTHEIADDLEYDEAEVERVLKLIQSSFEPTGVGARNVQESLLIQMQEQGLEDTLAVTIVRHHFADFEQNNLPKIAKALKIDIADVLTAIDTIKIFELYPGRQYGIAAPVRLRLPDVIIQKVSGEYKIISNDDGMPKLRVNKQYIDLIRRDNTLSPKTRDWLENSKRNAIDLLRSVEQRRRTILNVTESIFKVQEDFLEEGVQALKPLLLREVADMAGVHESTVSRVSRGKYVQTPQGIYELKDFFSGGLDSSSGKKTSTTVVKEMIKKIIEAEAPANPLSDQDIADILLMNEGISAARRTVAKYRNELKILPSSKRKKEW